MLSSQAQLSLHWQWNANYQPEWYSLSARPGYLRLNAQPEVVGANKNLWLMPSLLLQKLSAPNFRVDVKVDFPEQLGEVTAGLLIFGEDYAWIGFRSNSNTDSVEIGYGACHGARIGCSESFTPVEQIPLDKTREARSIELRVTMNEGGSSVFAYKLANGRYRTIGEMFQATPGRWVGAKMGLFARIDAQAADSLKTNKIEQGATEHNYIDVDFFRVTTPTPQFIGVAQCSLVTLLDQLQWR